MDNASNNDTAMKELEVILAAKNIKFDAQDQRIRCYPHIINICVSHIIKSLAKVGEDWDENEDGSEEADGGESDDEDSELADDDDKGYIGDTDEEDEEDEGTGGETDKAIVSKYVEEDTLLNWFEAVKRNPVNIARKLIRSVRASGQKREVFQMTISMGNQSKAFKDDNGDVVQVKQLQFVRDVKHRWDSLFLMLERMKDLQPV